mmetsp:Transcript_5377/g.7757  ORF Transcript_5377/g.7757 Transcript_5377/m.7757 type:complete len:484 (+) Transcript_5377:103-1554(+)
MDDTSIINKEFSASLQIDCNLETSTSLTSESSFTTPKHDSEGNYKEDSSSCSCNNHNNEPSSEWENLYKQLKRTPPKRTRDPSFHITVEQAVRTANKLLELTHLTKFKNMTFDNLQDDQKAILLLMIVKEMDTVFEATTGQTADILLGALVPESSEYKRMMGFVRKGCDVECSETETTNLVANFERYVKEFDITIFKVNPDMTPFLILQQEDSYICSYNASAALLYYCSYNNGHEDGDKIISTIKMSVGKYIRDEVPGDEIANVTLTTIKGAYLKKVLLTLMKSFGTTDCNDVHTFRTCEPSEEITYEFLKIYLRMGIPFGFCIENFPGLGNKKIMEYTGPIAGYYINLNERPLNPKERCYHSLLCIGISPRNNDNPPMLLVQDSCSIRPVFSVGLDLLMDMGLYHLEFCTVPHDWTFNENAEYSVSPATRALLCGSPMSVDNKGVPHVINTKKPLRKKREDMSHCLHKNVKPVNGIFAFMHG